jgi:hypothetical protein
MKTKLLAVVAALLLSVVATSVCYAQQTALTVTIPFAFQAGNQTMPAGEYRVESVLTGTGQLQRLRQVNGSAVMIVSTMSVEARNGIPNPELVFNRYGQTYFLSQIWTGGDQGRQLFKSNREKEIMRGEPRAEIALLLHPTSARP